MIKATVGLTLLALSTTTLAYSANNLSRRGLLEGLIAAAGAVTMVGAANAEETEPQTSVYFGVGKAAPKHSLILCFDRQLKRTFLS